MKWWVLLIVGFVLFVDFYYILPVYLESSVITLITSNETKANIASGSQWLGVILGLIGIYFAIRSYFNAETSKTEDKNL